MELHLPIDRVAFYLVSFSGGGAEREMIYLANAFAIRGYVVDLIVHRHSGPLEALVDPRVNKVIIDKTYLHDVLFLINYMRQKKPVYVMSALHVPNWALAISKAMSFTNTRVSWRVVTNLTYANKYIGDGITKMNRYAYPLLSRFVDSVICVSKGVADDVVNNYNIPSEKVKVMYNPAYNDEIHEQANCSASHPWLNGKYQTVVAMGRLSIAKGFDDLITSFKKVHVENDKARLIIFGEGELRESLEQLIDKLGLSESVELYGFEINPYKYLSKANLFVSSSVYEGFGNVIVEALALNIPVVSTNCPSGPSEILDNGTWGRLVSVGDTEALSTAILESLSNPHGRDTNVRAKVFTVDQVVCDYIKIINS